VSNQTRKEYSHKKYVFIREHGGWDNWQMIEVEKYPCKDMNEACARERHWYEELKAKLNKQIPNRSSKEGSLAWYYANRDWHNKQQGERRKKTCVCECGSKITIGVIARHKKSVRHQNFISSKCIDGSTNQENITSSCT
jgi:hypothetical protein